MILNDVDSRFALEGTTGEPSRSRRMYTRKASRGSNSRNANLISNEIKYEDRKPATENLVPTIFNSHVYTSK